MSVEMELSIIIVNWNSANFVQNCLSSVCESTKGIQFEIIVVDNDSDDGCGEMIGRYFPDVRFISGRENLGFAKANNLGFGHSTGRNILFLNPDTEVVGSAIVRLARFLDNTPDAGILGARLLNSDHSIQTSCIQRFPTIVNQVLDAEYLRRLAPRSSVWGTRPLIDNISGTAAVEVISGACQMLRREVFEQVGLYNADYFMYAEDADLCFKVRQKGWKNYYVGDAIIIHHGGKSSGAKAESNFSSVMMRESLHKFFAHRRGKLHAAAYRAITGLSALFRLGLLASLTVVTLGRFRRDTLSAAIGKWNRIFRWTIGLEDWVKTISPRKAGGENPA
jgi:GT2 family glycosyltransferase